jgi:hypothetical protein
LRARDVDGFDLGVRAVDGLEFDQQNIAVDPVNHAFELADPAVGFEMAAQRRGFGQIGELRADDGDGRDQISAEFGRRLVQQVFGAHAQQDADIGTGLDDAQARLAQREQQPVRLHRSREVDQLTFAVAEVRLAEWGAGEHYGASALGSRSGRSAAAWLRR